MIPLHNWKILTLRSFLLPHHLQPLAIPLLRRPLLPHRHNLKIRRRILQLGSVPQSPNSIQVPAVPGTSFTCNIGEEVAEVRSDVIVEKLLVLSQNLRFVDSDAEFEGINDAPFSLFAVDGLEFVGVDEAGFHNELGLMLVWRISTVI